MIRVGETFYRPQNYSLAFQKFFGKKISAEEEAARARRVYLQGKLLEERKRGKASSHPEEEHDHTKFAGYFPGKAKALWYKKKLKEGT